MQKVVNISLNGIAYQLEEPGYNQLRTYLERAESRLKDSPDRTEVVHDLGQAIGEKCARVLGPHKTVVNEAEVAKIIEEMGPVESPEEKAAGAGAAPEGAPEQASPYMGTQPRKRLFNIREGDHLFISVEGSSIVLRKMTDSCTFCGSETRITQFKGRGVCSSCRSQLRS